ncbi:MAG: deoxyribose-phosphate aldolase [Clostridiales bacterium]|jgi:deoxyribose-phosphate aldolase|nr:deoxyribose-phosphate aldolase [Clostridiales bacterium]
MNKEDIAKMIDHTLLKPDAGLEGVKKLCDEAKVFNFASVCVNPYYTQYAKQLLDGSSVKVCTVIGFPLGATPTEIKVSEANYCIKNGAEEIDMVINIGAVKNRDYKYVEEDVKAVVAAAKSHGSGIIVKVIIEACLLNQEEKENVITLLLNTGADFVKTSTGFSTGGATVEDIALMKKIVGNRMLIKASGGIRDLNSFMKMVSAGADRIGTSNGVTILS